MAGRFPIPADQSGASAIEFALVAPVLIVMLGAIFTISMTVRAHNSLSTYAREAARGIALGYMTVAEAKTFAEKHARDDLHVVVNATIDPPTRGDQNDRDVIVTMSIPVEELGKMTPFGNWIPGGVSSRVVMRALTE